MFLVAMHITCINPVGSFCLPTLYIISIVTTLSRRLSGEGSTERESREFAEKTSELEKGIQRSMKGANDASRPGRKVR